MAVEGGTKVIKYLLFIFNLLFLLAGLALIIIGAVAAAKLAPYSSIAGIKFNGVGVFLIIIGIIIFFISFFGCLGAYKENYCLLIVFIILMILSLLALVAAIIAAFVMRNQVYTWIGDGLNSTMIPQYNPNPNNTNDQLQKKLWDEIQQNEKCCGSYSFKDWQKNKFLNVSSSVPDSCCIINSTDCGKNKTTDKNPSNVFSDGCSKNLGNLIFHNVVAVGGAAAAIAILQFIGIVFASCLAHGIRQGYSTV